MGLDLHGRPPSRARAAAPAAVVAGASPPSAPNRDRDARRPGTRPLPRQARGNTHTAGRTSRNSGGARETRRGATATTKARRATAASTARSVVAVATAAAAAVGLSAAQQVPPTCSPASVDLSVSTAAHVSALLQATNCSGGVFAISWEGALNLSEPIVVGNSSSVSVFGVGDDAALDGGGESRLFHLLGGASLYLENLELRNGMAVEYTEGGGAIYTDGDELSLTASSCNFTNNYSHRDGGAILSTGALAYLEFTSCRFQGNTAEQYGGAIKANSAFAVTARDSLFLENTADSTLSSAWSPNDGEGEGGAVHLSGGTPQLEFHQCVLRANNATERGGAVFYEGDGGGTVGGITVNSTSFEANWAQGYGGGIRGGGIGQVDIIDSSFTDNYVSEAAIWGSASFSTPSGGGIYIYGESSISLRSSMFSGNGAQNGGGAAFEGNHTVVVEECLFDENLSNDEGGGMLVGLAGSSGLFDASITDTVFSGNLCGGNGGGLYSQGWGDGTSNVTLVRTSFFNNSVAYSDDLPNNPGSHRGGGYYSFSSSSTGSPGVFTLAEDCVFEGNHATAHGGALCVDGGTLSATDCDFSGNTAGSGGALSASGHGGTYPGATLIAVRGGQLLGNAAELRSWDLWDGYGGAAFAEEGAEIELYDVPVVGNRGGFGGAVSLATGARGSAWGVNFSGNAAEIAGGAVQLWGNASLFVAEGCVFLGNAAQGEARSTSSSGSEPPTVDAGGPAGGALSVSDGGAAFVLDSKLSDNIADGRGGGIFCGDAANVTVGRADFESNSAGELGGGIHCFECTMVALNTTFEGNTANGDGGGMRLSSASTVTINLCTFTNNKGGKGAGSVRVTQLSRSLPQDAKIEMRGCNSNSNTATLGGSIYMSRSELLLRKCLFSGDTVPTGSTIYTLGATVRARESTFEDIYNNTGILAIQAVSETEFQAQDCYFIGWAGSNVVLADQTGHLELDGCDFRKSTASSMVRVQDGGSLAIVRNARLSTGNYRAVNYGADLVTASDDNSSVSLFGSNIAGCSTSGCSNEEECMESDLGVYCACYSSVVDLATTCLDPGGKLTLAGPSSALSTIYPDNPMATLVLSWDDDGGTAGTLSSSDEDEGGPGVWELVWEDDPSSVAWVAVPSNGLALAIVGFPGGICRISLEGEVSRLWNGQITTVITAEAPYQEEVDAAATTVNATYVYCTQGEYWRSIEVVCELCADLDLNPQGVECDSEGILLETLPLATGYWRSSHTSTVIRECFNDDACVGSTSAATFGVVSERDLSVDDYCATGYMGPYCAVCVDGYTIGVSHTCHSCDSPYWAGMVVIMALTGVVLVVGVVIILNDLVGNPALTDLSETPLSVWSRRLRKMPFHKLKIPLVVLQIMTQYASITSIEFPSAFQTFLSTLSVINLELGWVFSSVCIIDVSFHGNLLAATIGPLLFLLVLLITYLYTCKKHGLKQRPPVVDDQASYPMSSYVTSSPRSPSETDTVEPAQSVIRRVQDKYATVALTMAFLLYSTVSTVIFQAFTCDHLEDVDKRYLRADYAIDCDSDRHKAFQVYAGVMILVYPIGIPIVFAIMLWRKRNIINPPKELLPPGGPINFPTPQQQHQGGERYGQPNEPDPRLADRRIAQTSFLWRAYRPGAYYFEVLECFRRLLLTGCLVFILPNTAGQAAVACVLAVLTVGVFAVVNPYSDAKDHRAYTLGALAVFLAMFMGLVVRVNLADEEAQSQRVLGVLLILLTVGLLVVAVVECLWEAGRLSSSRNGGADNDDHIFLRRRRGDRKKEGGGGAGAGKGGEMDDKYRTSGSLYAPKLLDVPMNRAFGASKNSGDGTEMFEGEKAAAAAAAAAASRAAPPPVPRPRGSQMFMMSANVDDDNRAHVAIAGTSSNLHPSTGRGGGYGGGSSYGGGGGGGGGEAVLSGGVRSSSSSHSPLHFRKFSGTDHARRGESGGAFGGMVPAEADSAPAGVMMGPEPDAPPLSMGGGGSGGGGSGGGGSGSARKKSRKSSRSRRDRGGRSSSRRGDSDGGGMRPANPDDGPVLDEMRPSAGDGKGSIPAPWLY
ncbi:unnamed protein product [Scytosiphon promiscuus]